ncbi:MAG: hypothetical protein IJ220_00905 [Clostridia bacterium]|nr:hypothetical protein [Clostridia bacterium]
MNREERIMNSNQKFKYFAIETAEKATEIIKKDKSKYAVLLCEGTEDSMDVYIYSKIYPEFIVIPSNGCTDVMRLMPFMRKYFEYKTFGLIDRDNCSKRRIRSLQKHENIYCTKLPFIENIICCPEVIKIIAGESGKDSSEVLRRVRNGLASILVDKMSLLNPFNIDLPEDKEVQIVSISIVTRSRTVHKTIDLANVMYTFRDKAIVSQVADAMDFRGRENYYSFLKEQIEGTKSEKILQAIAKYLPEIPYDEF